jgi:hypothetical protein
MLPDSTLVLPPPGRRAVLTGYRSMMRARPVGSLASRAAMANNRRIPPVDANEAHGWGALRFLLGEWRGDGGGAPGEGEGAFSFTVELQRGHRPAQLCGVPSHGGASRCPPRRSDDSLSRGAERGPARCTSTAKGTLSATPSSRARWGAQSSSRARSCPNAPRFWLTYKQSGDDALALSFEIAPPGQPEAFAPYIQARARRR